MSESRRQRRVAETIRKHVADALARDLFDPLLAGLIVTNVEVAPDLSLARIRVRSLQHGADPESRARVERSANRSVAALRRGLGGRLGLRRTPDIRFHYDEGQDAIDRVEEILAEIELDRRSETDSDAKADSDPSSDAPPK